MKHNKILYQWGLPVCSAVSVRDVARRWFLIAVLSVLFALAAYVLMDRLYEPEYECCATLAVSAPVGFTTVCDNINSAGSLASVFSEILNSSVMRNRILEELNLTGFSGTISASRVKETNLLELKVRSCDPQAAFLVVQALIENHEMITREVIGDISVAVLEDPTVPAEPVNPLHPWHVVGWTLVLAALGVSGMFAAVSLLRDTARSAKRLWVWLPVFVLITAATALCAGRYFHRPVYETSVSFTVRVADPLCADGTTYHRKTAEQMEKTVPNILTSAALKQRVQKYLDLEQLPVVGASVHRGSHIFMLSVRDPDPRRAQQVLEGVTVCYPDVAQFVVGPTNLVILDASGIPADPVNPFCPGRYLAMGGTVGSALWLLLCVLDTRLRAGIREEEDLKSMPDLLCMWGIFAIEIPGKWNPGGLVRKSRKKCENGIE